MKIYELLNYLDLRASLPEILLRKTLKKMEEFDSITENGEARLSSPHTKRQVITPTAPNEEFEEEILEKRAAKYCNRVTDDLGYSFLRENSLLPDKYLEILKNINIKIYWKVPSYKRFLFSSKGDLKKWNTKLRTNHALSYEEKEILIKNWKRFCKKNHLQGINFNVLISHEILKQEQLRNLLCYIGRGIDKTLLSIKTGAIDLFSPPRMRPVTGLEYDICVKYFYSKCRSRAHELDIAFILNGRLSPGVYRPIENNRTMFANFNDSAVYIIIEAFADYFKQYSNMRDINRENCFNPIYKNIKNDLKDLCGERISCRIISEYWLYQLSTQVLLTEPLHLNHLLIKVIRILYESEYDCWTDIRWRKLARQIDRISPHFLCHQFMLYVVTHVPKLHYLSFKQAMEILHNHFIKQLLVAPDKILPALPIDPEMQNIFEIAYINQFNESESIKSKEDIEIRIIQNIAWSEAQKETD